MFDDYITKAFYRAYPAINPIADDDELDIAIAHASRVMDKITFQRATYKSEMTDDEVECLEYATAAQVDYIEGLGYNPADMSSADYNEGFSIGKYSSSGKTGEDLRNVDAVSETALGYLRACNLTENGFKDATYPSDYTFTGGD